LEHPERIDVAVTTDFRAPVKIASPHMRILLLGRGKLTDALPTLHGLANAEGRSCRLKGGMDSPTINGKNFTSGKHPGKDYGSVARGAKRRILTSDVDPYSS
jgi:hypothetical protein